MKPFIKVTVGLGLLGGIGAIVYQFAKRDKQYLIFHVTQGVGVSAFRTTANRASQLFDTSPIPANNAQDLLNGFSREGKFDVVVFAGHGSPSSFLLPGVSGLSATRRTQLPTWINVDDFARRIAPKLARGVIISFAGCRTGADPGESDWAEASYYPGGARGLAGKLRDSHARLGVTGEIRSKSTTGTSFGNPVGRLFPISTGQIGRPGIPLIDLVWGRNSHRDPDLMSAWISRVRGEPAVSWTIGGDLPDIRRS